MHKNLYLFCLLALHTSLVSAKTWQVGPSRTYKVPSAVASLVTDGDTIEIDAGLYTGDVARWFANNLIIKGIGAGRAHLEANGKNAEGKAIWVVKGKNCHIESLEFSGCTVPDQNGAGIRQEGQNLTLVNCFFHHNEMGILTSNDGVSDYVFESCEFSENGYGDGNSHNIYVGHANSLTLRYCYSHDAKVGHLVKSRAQRNFLYYNRLTLEKGDGSYEIDLPNGGLAVLVGNMIEQGAASENGGIISFGLEGATNTIQQIVLSHNTVLNNRFDGRFLQYGGATLVKMVNNAFLGPGTLLQGTGATLDTAFNIRLLSIAAAQLKDAAHFDFHPVPGSPCVDRGAPDPGNFAGISLLADRAYAHPLGYAPRTMTGLRPDAGAFERELPSASEEVATNAAPVVFPNPFRDYIFIKNANENAKMMLYNTAGQVIFQGKNIHETDFSALPPGVYFLKMEDHLHDKIYTTLLRGN